VAAAAKALSPAANTAKDGFAYNDNFHFTDDEIYRYLFSNYKQDKDLHKRPLSKLIKDISEELGIL
jgi:hypothetical protein